MDPDSTKNETVCSFTIKDIQGSLANVKAPYLSRFNVTSELDNVVTSLWMVVHVAA